MWSYKLIRETSKVLLEIWENLVSPILFLPSFFNSF
jgi:hypothetical protein